MYVDLSSLIQQSCRKRHPVVQPITGWRLLHCRPRTSNGQGNNSLHQCGEENTRTLHCILHSSNPSRPLDQSLPPDMSRLVHWISCFTVTHAMPHHALITQSRRCVRQSLDTTRGSGRRWYIGGQLSQQPGPWHSLTMPVA